MNDKQTITPSKPISQCFTGWVLCWQDMTASGQNSGSVDRVTIVDKMSVYSHSGQGFVQAMMNYGNTNSAKYVYINDKTITGKDFNGTDSSRKTVAIVNVYSF